MKLDLLNMDPDFMARSQEKLYTAFVINYLNLHHLLNKLTGPRKNIEDNRANSKNSFPANIHDICNYLARFGLANYQIQPVLRLDGHLDFELLKKAVQLVVEAEPVFGSRFVEGSRPYWTRIENLDADMLCSMEVTDNAEEAVKRFLEGPLDVDRDPMVKVKLIRTAGYDTLCMKISHIACDGAGVKEFIQLLSEYYSTLSEGNTVLILEPRIAGRKDQERLLANLGITDPKAIWKPLQESPKTMWPFPWGYIRTNVHRYELRRLPVGYIDKIHAYGRARGATVHDVLLTAYYRALFEYSNVMYGTPMDISTTVDLRRYLPDRKTQAIRNFSGGFVTRIARIYHEPFEKTLSRVVVETQKAKERGPGLQNAIGGEIIQDMDFAPVFSYFRLLELISSVSPQFPVFTGSKASPGLSNLGFISRNLIKFGSVTATDAYIIPPAIRSPGFLLLACTYNGVLTLSTSYYKGSIRRKDVQRLLDMVKEELLALQ